MATQFERIKNEIDKQKEKKMRGEARESSLLEENKRVLEEVNDVLDEPVKDSEEGEKVQKELEQGIKTDVDKIASILDDEGLDW